VTLSKHVPPARAARAFNCPLCGAYSAQHWNELGTLNGMGGFTPESHVASSTCLHCKGVLYWFDTRIFEPSVSVGPPPSPDLPERVTTVYVEAASVASNSPRAAAALLRLSVQILCAELSSKERLDDQIADLVGRGLPVQVQRALDVVRVVGNNAVHPGEIALADDQDTVAALFGLVNAIATELISRPAELEAMYGSLPESIRVRIEKRDAKA
jgi:hypothetical protein